MGGGIHHHVRRGAGDQRLQLFGAVEIRDFATRTAGQQAIARGGNDLTQRREAALQLGAHLPVRAEPQAPQGAYTGSRSAATSASSGGRVSVSDEPGAATGQQRASARKEKRR